MDLGFLATVWGDESEAFSLAQGSEIGTLLFGRRTYEGMASHRAAATGAVADMMNSVEKAVATRTLDKAMWNDTRLLKGDAVEELWINSGESWMQVPLVGGTFPDAFMGVMSNLQRFATGEDEVLRTSVDDAWHTMALAEACFCSSASPATPVQSSP